jgi:hypothetical protein
MPSYLKTPAAADYLQRNYGIGSGRTLNKLRVIGGGPSFHKFRRQVVYFPAELDAWVEAGLSPPLQRTPNAPHVRKAAKKANPEIAAE